MSPARFHPTPHGRPNSRIHVTGTLTINAGATLTIGEGTIVTLYSGNGTAGSAAEIVV